MSQPEKTVALAGDHRGYELKNKIMARLQSMGYETKDCGTYSTASADYPDFIFQAAEMVQKGTASRAIGICYTGIGSSIAANKVKGVRAALVKTEEEAQLTRAHNDSNMLILGAGFLEPETALKIVKVWMETPFEGGRHAERVSKIKSYEQKHS